ncbi:MAG TPA: SDR family oxidoreductase [Fimbriimonadaceae bacterium]|nr:hypothetical protein [Armatimonadota bacterium]HCM73487.1 hypothetical protein [Armatimonadota bacterium]HRD31856.1 SDR family oxidoreductase [Fimbriimonadaceae bacterium]HRE94864.1 SDR family oxidoreductase [Fimbriimonadaceae bacterium]HRI73263.1 SDR family oxidoreductase [Fimbriimonadaceae bacterium]
MGEFAGKTVLVTGAAQGIGQAIAEAFRAEGATVLGLDRQAGATEITFDLSEVSGIHALIDGLETCPDVLVNAAGICHTRRMLDIDLPSFEQTFRINVTAAFALMQATAARLIREGRTGCVINIASNSGFVPKLEQADYGASKAALVSLTRSAALSLGPSGIRVNAIAPGIIDTPLTQSIAVQRGEVRGVAPEETLRPVIANLPLGRMGQPEEIAQMAVFLASARAAYITGQTILVDGGQWMR